MKRILILLLGIMLMLMPLTSCSKDSGGGAAPSDGGSQTDIEDDEDEDEDYPDDEEDLEGWNAGDAYVPDENEVLAGDTLEERLHYLERDKWQRKGTAYVFTTEEEGTSGEYTITAKGNDANIKVDFDYGRDNKEMRSFYKGDKKAAKAVCAYWYLRATDATGMTEGNVHYTLLVGGKQVTDGDMTYDQAFEAYYSYFGD